MSKLKLFTGLMMLVITLSGTPNVADAHTRTIKIKVDKNGFSPSSIDVEAGHKLNLVFNRADNDNCGNTVVFPKLKIRKTLPIGKDIIVSITPKDAGNVSFTCGTGTHKGSLIVID